MNVTISAHMGPCGFGCRDLAISTEPKWWIVAIYYMLCCCIIDKDLYHANPSIKYGYNHNWFSLSTRLLKTDKLFLLASLPKKEEKEVKD
jgi:hypothetical protein